MQTIMQQEENLINVPLIEPRLKHPTIFKTFDEMGDGSSLTILNDHDPKPVYYQLLGERGNVFKWEYLEQGPEVWRVKITKKLTGEGDETLGEIATKDLRKAEIFKKYGLDFCCGGKKTVKQACAEKGLDVTKIEQELQQADKNPTARPLNYSDWSMDFLADYIVNTHHSYVAKTLPELRGYAAKVASVHGNRHPELVEVYNLVEEINDELTDHMAKEENILFPFIKLLSVAQKSGKHEHEMVGKNLERIRTITSNYALPEDACASYNVLFKMMQEFENDLFTHIHLENNILFPQAFKAEKNMN
jgi:regulator of cell morphogenesis and NO signaling